MNKRHYYALFLLLALAACQSTPPEPGMKLGKPYAVDGEMYYPEYEPNYDETGDASWYGPGFHGKYTANGEIFDQNALTAAHPTLPMPSLVRVTNLSNGKSLIVRINDRGPFKSHRIIDLSKESARQLGVRSISKVRVQYLKQETTEYIAAVQRGERNINIARYDRPLPALIPDNPQIEESTEASSHAGQTVDDAAPVMTVSATELEKPEARPHGGLIKSAWAEEPPPQKTSSPSQPVATSDAYLVQAGSFATEENAFKLATKLSAVGTLSIEKADRGEKPLWRVRLGPFDNRQDADDALSRVRAAGAPDAEIVHL